MLDLTLEIAAWTLTIAGLAVIAWALLWDPGRRQRRCPGCWYDMGGAGPIRKAGLRCPECGRITRRERSFHRRRRRWRWALGATAILLLAYSAVATPRIRERGWVGVVPTTALVLLYPVLIDHADANYVDLAIHRWTPPPGGIPPPRPPARAKPTQGTGAPAYWGRLIASDLLAALCVRVRDEQITGLQFETTLRLMLATNADAVYSGIDTSDSARLVCGYVLRAAQLTGLITDRQTRRLDAGNTIRIELPEFVLGDGGVWARVDPRFWSTPPWHLSGRLEVYDNDAAAWRRLPETYSLENADWVRWVKTVWLDRRCIGPNGEVRFRAHVWSPRLGQRRRQEFRKEWQTNVLRVNEGALIVPVNDETVVDAITYHFREEWLSAFIDDWSLTSDFTVSLCNLANSVYMNHPATADHRTVVHRPNRSPRIEPPTSIFTMVFDGVIGLRFRLLVAGSPIAEGAIAWASFERMADDTGGLKGRSATWGGQGVDVGLAVLPDAADTWLRAEADVETIQDLDIELEVSGDPNVAKRIPSVDRCLVFARRFAISNAPQEYVWLKERVFYATSRPLPARDWGPIGPVAPDEVVKP